jgi:hypothetical protein
MFMASVISTVIALAWALILTVPVILDLLSMTPVRNSVDATRMSLKVFAEAPKKGKCTMSKP